MKFFLRSFHTLLGCAAMFTSSLQATAQETPAAPATERILLVGDSTVASKTGWGDAFGNLLLPTAEWSNQAKGGRSSKSYADEGLWIKALEYKPTWVLIQFGHNDQPGKGPQRETDPKTTFRENLERYVTEARAIGAKPVLVTSLTRRNFNAEGKIDAAHLEPATDGKGEKMRDWLYEFSEGTRAVAAKMNVPLIDLNARSIELANKLGPEASVSFDAASKDPAKPDKTHLSEKGAEEIAKLVADEVRKNIPELAKQLKP